MSRPGFKQIENEPVFLRSTIFEPNLVSRPDYSIDEIAEALGMTHASAYRLYRALGLVGKREPLPADEAEALIAEKVTLAQAAKARRLVEKKHWTKPDYHEVLTDEKRAGIKRRYQNQLRKRGAAAQRRARTEKDQEQILAHAQDQIAKATAALGMPDTAPKATKAEAKSDFATLFMRDFVKSTQVAPQTVAEVAEALVLGPNGSWRGEEKGVKAYWYRHALDADEKNEFNAVAWAWRYLVDPLTQAEKDQLASYCRTGVGENPARVHDIAELYVASAWQSRLDLGVLEK